MQISKLINLGKDIKQLIINYLPTGMKIEYPTSNNLIDSRKRESIFMKSFETPEIRFVNSPGEFSLPYSKTPVSDETKADLFEINTNGSNKLSNYIDFADEAGLRKRGEKELLLSFSRDIATAEDKKGLGLVIKQYLKNLFRIKEYIITVRNDDELTYSHFLHDLDGETPTDKGFQIITGSTMPVAGSMTGMLLKSEAPMILNIADIIQKRQLSFPSASFWRSAGAEQILGIRLKVADKDIGILWIQPGYVNDHLLKGVAAQIAISISNIFANEKICRHLTEIDHYKRQLKGDDLYVAEEVETAYNKSGIIGNSPSLKRVFRLVTKVANSDCTVLILGETGTGKDVVARAIHNSSTRKNKLMVRVNCGALPAGLIESELFGHERGSFTGATERRVGKFELANNGSLFLDEIGELQPELQVKLLRAIQEKEIERVGGNSTIKVNVRIIAATNQDLEKAVAEGRFRSDLFYRLNVFPVTLPPLRERREDIPLLASHFIEQVSRKTASKVNSITRCAMLQLIQHNWPGNIRELEHLIERSILLTTGNTIREIHLHAPKNSSAVNAEMGAIGLKTIADNERDHIIATLKYCQGRISGAAGAAEILGMPPTTLHSRIKRLGIKRKYISGKDVVLLPGN